MASVYRASITFSCFSFSTGLVAVAFGLICAVVLFIILLILVWKWRSIVAAWKWKNFKERKKRKELIKDSRIVVHPKIPRPYFSVPTYPVEVQQPITEGRSIADPTKVFDPPNHFPRIYHNTISEVVSPTYSIVQEIETNYPPSLSQENRTVSLCDINTDLSANFGRCVPPVGSNKKTSYGSNGKNPPRGKTRSPRAKRKIVLQSKPEGEIVGLIEFSFTYDASKQHIRVHVVEASDLVSDEAPDCYVSAALVNDRKLIWEQKTEVVPMSIHPHFDATLEGFKLSPAKVHASVLRFHVFDVHSSKLIGEALLPVADIEENDISSLSSSSSSNTLLTPREETDDTEGEVRNYFFQLFAL